MILAEQIPAKDTADTESGIDMTNKVIEEDNLKNANIEATRKDVGKYS